MKLFTNGELIENEDKIKDFLITNYKKQPDDKTKEDEEIQKLESQIDEIKHKILSIKD